jgi:hypothetical protein
VRLHHEVAGAAHGREGAGSPRPPRLCPKLDQGASPCLRQNRARVGPDRVSRSAPSPSSLASRDRAPK